MRHAIMRFPIQAAIVLLVLSAVSEVGWSQQAGAVLRRPDQLSDYDKCLGPQPAARSKEFWRVWTDREVVPVYVDKELQNPKNELLGLLQPFYVAEVNDSKTAMLLIRSKSEPFAQSIVVDAVVGWVKTEHLLLNTSTARTEKSIPKRAFIINDMKQFTTANKVDFEKNEVIVRKSPDKNAPALRTLSGSDIFSYIYKYDHCGNHEWFLVGSKNVISNFSGPEDVIIGWVPRLRVAEWNTREAFEPDAARKSPGNIYMTAEDMRANKVPLFADRNQRERWAAERWRYILMDEVPQGTKEAKVGFLGDVLIEDAPNAAVASSVADADLPKKIQQVYDVLTNINVIFVMDATASMGPYLKQVADTADRIMGQIKVDDKTVKVSYGAVVYRDLENSPKEQFDVQELTDKIQQVSAFLRKQKEPTPGVDKDYEEAMFGGLEIAFEQLAQKNKRNIVVIIGDAGNSDVKGSLDEPSLIKWMKDKNIYLYAVHIQRPARAPAEAAAIQKFETDTQRLFKLLDQVRDPGREHLGQAWPKQAGAIPEYRATALERTALNQEDVKGTGDKVAGAVREQIKLALAMVQYYARCIDEGFEKCLTTTTASAPPRPSSNGDPTLYEIKAAMLDVVAQMVPDMKLFREMIENKVQIFQPGWTRVIDDSGTPIMKPMYLISQDDLLNSIRAVQDFARPGGSDAIGLVEIWRQLIRERLGTVPDNPEDYLEMSTGLSFRSLSPFLGRSFDQLSKASPGEITAFMNAAKAAIDKLQKLRYDDSLWFRNYGEHFAWVPAADLP